MLILIILNYFYILSFDVDTNTAVNKQDHKSMYVQVALSKVIPQTNILYFIFISSRDFELISIFNVF